MDILNEEIENLILIKNEYINQSKHMIQLLEKQIKNMQNKIYETCIKDNGDHKWIMEVEKGVYGETYYYCEKCKYLSD